MKCPCCDTELHALVQATTDNEMILACESCRDENCSRYHWLIESQGVE